MNKQSSKTVIVLGMHRSGTSMTSAILNELGVNMGKSLSNPIGHFEDLEFLYLNIEILKAAGGDCVNVPKAESILNQKYKFKEKIKLLTNKPNLHIWGWKYPRTSLTAALYLPYVNNPYFVVCYRKADEIAISLKKRDNFNIEHAKKLKEIYDKRIEEFFRNNIVLNRLNLYYNAALYNPAKYIDKIIRFLELEISKDHRNRAINLILSKKELNKLADNSNPKK